MEQKPRRCSENTDVADNSDKVSGYIRILTESRYSDFQTIF